MELSHCHKCCTYAGDNPQSYQQLSKIGEGTYGVVLKCRSRDTGQLVAVKKFKDSDNDQQVRKTALREIRLLKQLRHHENVVKLIEVFRRRGKVYLVFEFIERTILEDLEANPNGLPEDRVRDFMCQLVRAVEYCHTHDIIHRDIKPENLLLGFHNELRLCDFGFARPLGSLGAHYSDYVATRWYRAPELLVGDTKYGKGVDVWALGCILVEVQTGVPAFPGQDDFDQLWLIINALGTLCDRHVRMIKSRSSLDKFRFPRQEEPNPLRQSFPQLGTHALTFLEGCFKPDPDQRHQAHELLKLPFFEPVLSAEGPAFPSFAASSSNTANTAATASSAAPQQHLWRGTSSVASQQHQWRGTSSIASQQHQKQSLHSHVKRKKSKLKSSVSSRPNEDVPERHASEGPSHNQVRNPNHLYHRDKQQQYLNHGHVHAKEEEGTTTLPFLNHDAWRRAGGEHEKRARQGSKASLATPQLPSLKPQVLQGASLHGQVYQYSRSQPSNVQVLQEEGKKKPSARGPVDAGTLNRGDRTAITTGYSTISQNSRTSKAHSEAGAQISGGESSRTPALETARSSKSRGADGLMRLQPVRQGTQEHPQPIDRRYRKDQQHRQPPVRHRQQP